MAMNFKGIRKATDLIRTDLRPRSRNSDQIRNVVRITRCLFGNSLVAYADAHAEAGKKTA